MDNLCNRKFKIKKSDLNWIACEELGQSGVAHVHLIFSFDHLRTKNRTDKIPKIDFDEEKGGFWKEVVETTNYIWAKFRPNERSVDIHWSPKWLNNGLVNYFCKMEGREEKYFRFSDYWKIQGKLLFI